MGRKVKDIAGQRSGALVAQYPTGTLGHGHALWVCRCDCGLLDVVRGAYLDGQTVTRCKNCQRLNLDPVLASEGIDIVAWYYGEGQEGGFAVAKDGNGALRARTNWSRKDHDTRIPRPDLIVVRWAMDILEREHVVRARHQKESYANWLAACKVRVEVREHVSWPTLLAEWTKAGGPRDKAHPMALPAPPPEFVPILTPPPEIWG